MQRTIADDMSKFVGKTVNNKCKNIEAVCVAASVRISGYLARFMTMILVKLLEDYAKRAS